MPVFNPLLLGRYELWRAIPARTLAVALGARRPRPDPNNIVDRVTALLSEHPVMGAGAALVAGLIALKNPKLATAALSAFLASRAGAKTRRR